MIDVPVLRGLIHVRRQSLVRVEWLADGDHVHTCWTAIDPASWAERVAAWDTQATWQPAGAAMGGWEVEPLGDGSRVSYVAWAADQTVVPGVQEWAMAWTMPEMIRAYAARVAALADAP